MDNQPATNRSATRIALVIGAIWVMLLVARSDFAMLPLYGLYPGVATSGDPGYSEKSLHLWAGCLGAVYLSLFVFGVFRKKTGFTILFLLLFFGSGVIGILRVVAAIGGVKG